MNVKIPGISILHKLRPGDEWIPNPFGPGLIIANPEHPPLWVRIEDNEIKKDEILGNWTDFPRQFKKWKAAWEASQNSTTHIGSENSQTVSGLRDLKRLVCPQIRQHRPSERS